MSKQTHPGVATRRMEGAQMSSYSALNGPCDTGRWPPPPSQFRTRKENTLGVKDHPSIPASDPWETGENPGRK